MLTKIIGVSRIQTERDQKTSSPVRYSIPEIDLDIFAVLPDTSSVPDPEEPVDIKPERRRTSANKRPLGAKIASVRVDFNRTVWNKAIKSAYDVYSDKHKKIRERYNQPPPHVDRNEYEQAKYDANRARMAIFNNPSQISADRPGPSHAPLFRLPPPVRPRTRGDQQRALVNNPMTRKNS